MMLDCLSLLQGRRGLCVSRWADAALPMGVRCITGTAIMAGWDNRAGRISILLMRGFLPARKQRETRGQASRIAVCENGAEGSLCR